MYEKDKTTGNFISLIQDLKLITDILRCPDCQTSIPQFSIQRYKRLITKIAIDRQVIQSATSGRQELQDLEGKVGVLRMDMERSRQYFLPDYAIPAGKSQAAKSAIDHAEKYMDKFLNMRYSNAPQVEELAEAFQSAAIAQQQTAENLQQSINQAHAKNESSAVAQLCTDPRIKHSCALLLLKLRSLVLEVKFGIACSAQDKFSPNTPSPSILGANLISSARTFFDDCIRLISTCNNDNLPKIAVEVSLYYARIVQTFAASDLGSDKDRKYIGDCRAQVKKLLDAAAQVCNKRFYGAQALAKAVQGSLKMLGSQSYPQVSKDEKDEIKRYMTEASEVWATEKGKWYYCGEGHAVSSLDISDEG